MFLFHNEYFFIDEETSLEMLYNFLLVTSIMHAKAEFQPRFVCYQPPCSKIFPWAVVEFITGEREMPSHFGFKMLRF